MTYTTRAPGDPALSNFANVNLGGSYTIYVSNVVTRPGPGCGPPIITTNTQVLTPTAVTHVGTLDANVLSLAGNAALEGTTNPGMITIHQPMQLRTNLFAALSACASGTEGTSEPVTDSTTATWGATITGGCTNHVLAYCDGTNWTVAAK